MFQVHSAYSGVESMEHSTQTLNRFFCEILIWLENIDNQIIIELSNKFIMTTNSACAF